MKPEALLDPEYQVFLQPSPSEWTLAGLPLIRARVSAGIAAPNPAERQVRWARSAAEGFDIRLCIYRPAPAAAVGNLPAVLYVHGGGFVLGSPEMAHDYLRDLAQALQLVIVAVDYRLAPEHPFPTPLEDCFTALQWLYDESAALGVDPRRVALMGHSAGGGLAAALALVARDRQTRPLAGLLLVYPMLDHRTGAPESPILNETLGIIGWGREANQFCWACLHGEQTLSTRDQPLFSPALATDLARLPPSFVCVGALDLFLEEGVEFSMKLSKAGVPVELHVYPGVPHLFDFHPGQVTEQCKLDVRRALAKMCCPST